MSRMALIISNPGELGSENYCNGVNRDVENYASFLDSPIGGWWFRSEVRTLPRPSVADVKQAVADLAGKTFAMVIFTGHGWYSSSLDATVLTLRGDQEMSSADLRAGATRQTVILDCCRVVHPGFPVVEAAMKFAARGAEFDGTRCRRYYDEMIEHCPPQIIFTFSCDRGQTAADDSSHGGLYSYNLIHAGHIWAQNSGVSTYLSSGALSVPQAHEMAAERVRVVQSGRQTPSIEKPRSLPYLPFAVVA